MAAFDVNYCITELISLEVGQILNRGIIIVEEYEVCIHEQNVVV